MNQRTRMGSAYNKNIKQPRQGAQQQINLNIDPSKLPDIYCIKCKCANFKSITKMKYLSVIQSPNGKEGAINMNFIVCDSCGHIFNLEEWKYGTQKTVIEGEAISEEDADEKRIKKLVDEDNQKEEDK